MNHLTPSEKIRKVNLAIYPSTLKKAREIATSEGRSVSNLFRWLIEIFYNEQLEKKGKSNIA